MRAIRFCFLGGVGETNKSPTPPAVCFLRGGGGDDVGSEDIRTRLLFHGWLLQTPPPGEMPAGQRPVRRPTFNQQILRVYG